MARCIVESAEKILDKEVTVLNKGFVRLVDYMGGDERIVQSARVSYHKGTKTIREDGALIDYLLRNAHTSPFEQVVLTFHCKMPIFIARQWIRHRTARLNEISGRYSIMEDEFYIPEVTDIAEQSCDNKQGRGEIFDVDIATEIQKQIISEQEDLYAGYKKLIDMGVAREIARINLPLSLYTQWYWQMDLNNLFHFLKLRLHSHAQKEIRAYAQVILELTQAVAPMAVASFKQHLMGGVTLSQEEKNTIRNHLDFSTIGLDERAQRILKEKLS
ncbi:MAG: FAD-dependent thymidylate synthase [Spirochaetia bacterium]